MNHVQKMEQGSVDVLHYGNSPLTVAVEYCSSLNVSKDSDIYFAFDNPKLKMITSGAWELDIYPHLPVSTHLKILSSFISLYLMGRYIRQKLLKLTMRCSPTFTGKQHLFKMKIEI